MAPVTATNITWHAGRLSRPVRWGALGHRGATVWFTGLSGSGKSTLASAVEERLVESGRPAYRLDGDNLRTGLNADLAFDHAGRHENIRRVAEVARLFADAGVVALAALISPFAESRAMARALHEDVGLAFVEVYCAAPVAVCAQRDPKGLYAKASSGALTGLTGVEDPYEEPTAPDLVVSHELELDDAVGHVIDTLARVDRFPD